MSDWWFPTFEDIADGAGYHRIVITYSRVSATVIRVCTWVDGVLTGDKLLGGDR